jgi:hypothetical protein
VTTGPGLASWRAAVGSAARAARRRLHRWRRRDIYGVARPPWWPPTRRWPFGPQGEHDGRRITIAFLGERHEFEPASLGRFRGHVYRGRLRPDAGALAARLTRLGLPAADARIFAVVSSLEGGFDTIQTYDRAKFSWGFIQYAATGGLPGLLHELKRAAPDRFRAHFGAAGLDIEETGIAVRVNGQTLRGFAALNRLHDEPALWKAFLSASKDEVVQDMQVRIAHERYYRPMLERSLRVGRRAYRLGDLFAGSELGRAVLFDRAVHRGHTYATRLLERAARQCGERAVADGAAILAAACALEARYAYRWHALRSAFEN